MYKQRDTERGGNLIGRTFGILRRTSGDRGGNVGKALSPIGDPCCLDEEGRAPET